MFGFDEREFAQKVREFVNAHSQTRLDTEDWITINGTHVLLGEGGVVSGGGKLNGMVFARAKSVHKEPKAVKEQGKKANKLPAVAMSDADMAKERKRLSDDEERGKWAYTRFLTRSRSACQEAINKQKETIEYAKNEIIRLSTYGKFHDMTKEEAEQKLAELKEEYAKKKKVEDRLNDKLSKLYESTEGREPTEQEKKEISRLDKKVERAQAESNEVHDSLWEVHDYLVAEKMLRKAEAELAGLESPDVYERERNAILDEYDADREKYNAAVRAKFPTVDDCKTAEDLSDYLRAQDYSKNRDVPPNWIGQYTIRSRESALKGISVEKVKTQVSAMEDMFAKYPILKKAFNGLSYDFGGLELGTGSWAATDLTSGRIRFGELFGQYEDCNIAEQYKTSTEPTFGENGERAKPGEGKIAFHPIGCDERQIVIHELCHNLDTYVCWKKNPDKDINDLVTDSHTNFSSSVKEYVSKQTGKLGMELWKGVSKYAEKDSMEWYAEAVSSYLLGNDCEQGRLAWEYTMETLKGLGVKTDSRADAEENWITINGTHVLVDETGVLKGTVGEKISKTSNQNKATVSTQMPKQPKQPEGNYPPKAPTRPKRGDYITEPDETSQKWAEQYEEYQKARDSYKEKYEQYKPTIEAYAKKELEAPMNDAEISEWSKKSGIDASTIDGIDRRVLPKITRELDSLKKDFPFVFNYTSVYQGYYGEEPQTINHTFGIGYNGENSRDFAYAGCNTTSDGITFCRSSSEGERYAYDTLDYQADGYNVNTKKGIGSLVDHEFGHNLLTYLELRKRTKPFASKEEDAEHTKRAVEMKEDLVNSLYKKSGMSEYATKNEEELFAEGFASWYAGEQTEFAKATGEFIERWMNK